MTHSAKTDAVPIIDISGSDDPQRAAIVAAEIDEACRHTGFFCIAGHGIAPDLLTRLDVAARQFFALDAAAKAAIAMPVGGRAWRGWFPLGGEVTNGIPDRKEGLYFGRELAFDHPRVAGGLPLHGPNLFPDAVPELRPAVLAWMTALTDLGQRLMALLGIGLGLGEAWFRDHLTADPTTLFRIFRYPDTSADARTDSPTGEWGVAEHTDYGLLTLLAQDECGGLQVRTPGGWTAIDPVPDSFVCNIGDMLERMTGGRYRSTPHRVRNTSGRERLSFPFFFDPDWDARIAPLPGADVAPPGAEIAPRWDGRSVFDFDGTYGEYLVAKVSKVFPELVHVI